MIIRNRVADLLKGIAVVLMIQVHIIELFATPSIYTSKFGDLFLFLGAAPVAPLFMIILGYYLSRSTKSQNQLILRGFKILCLGMLLNLALNLNLIISVSKGLFQLDLKPYIFGVDILQFAGLAIILITFLKKSLEKSFIPLLIFIIASPIIGSYLMQFKPENATVNYITAFFVGNAHWSYFPLFPWLSYPLAGAAFYHLQKRYDFGLVKSTSIKIIGLILFLVFALCTFKYSISICTELQLYYHHSIIFFLWTILFIVFYSFFVNELELFFGNTILLRYIKWLGKNVTFIYVIQWIIIGNIATEIYRTVSSPSLLILYFLSTLAASSGITFMTEKVMSSLRKRSALN